MADKPTNAETKKIEGARVLRAPEVRRITSYSRAQIWRLERLGRFPKRIQLSENAVGWLSTEVYAWLEERAKARASAVTGEHRAA